jgi:hypothetical protein
MPIDKKKAAAIAAVAAFLQQEAETAALNLAEIGASATAVTETPLRMWGASGRQEQMHLRQLMQLKTFHGARSRGR